MQQTRDRKWIINRVSVRIDEFIPPAQRTLSGTASESPVETIDDELDFAALEVLRKAKEELIHYVIETEKKMFVGDDVNDTPIPLIINDDLIATVVCPENFLRVVSIKTSGMKRDIRNFHNPDDPTYRRVNANQYTGGNYIKPSAFVVSFNEHELRINGTITNSFQVGEKVVGSGNLVSNITIPYGYVKKIGSGYLILENVVGSFDPDGRGCDLITGEKSGATISVDTMVDGINKYKVLNTFTVNVNLSELYNAQEISDQFNDISVATGDIVVLSKQSDPSENGTYKVGANAAQTLKLSNDITTQLPKQAIEIFRAKSKSDTLEKFHYIPKVKPEQFPDTLLDALIDIASARVLRFMGKVQESSIAMDSGMKLIGAQKIGTEEDRIA